MFSPTHEASLFLTHYNPQNTIFLLYDLTFSLSLSLSLSPHSLSLS